MQEKEIINWIQKRVSKLHDRVLRDIKEGKEPDFKELSRLTAQTEKEKILGFFIKKYLN